MLASGELAVQHLGELLLLGGMGCLDLQRGHSGKIPGTLAALEFKFIFLFHLLARLCHGPLRGSLGLLPWLRVAK